MKKHLIVIIALLACQSLLSNAQPGKNRWTQKNDFPGNARSSAVSFSIGGKVYMGTGYNYDVHTATSFFYKDLWEYDPLTDKWVQKADFGGGIRAGAVAFVIGNKGYIGTGSDGQISYKDLWEYDPLTDKWAQKADLPGGARSGGAAFAIDAKGYVGTGDSGSYVHLNDLWEYTPSTNTWLRKTDFPGTKRFGAVGFSINGKGYIGLGNGGNPYPPDVWEYDPSTNTWTQKTSFNGIQREYATVFTINDKAYIGTGYYYKPLKDLWEYDGISDKWIQKSNFAGDARFGAVGFSVNGNGYFATGTQDPPYFKDCWLYTPDGDVCALPFSLNVTDITDTSAKLQWSSSSDSVAGFEIVYSKAAVTDWVLKLRSSASNSIIIKGLSPHTLYKWRMRSACNNRQQSSWVLGSNFVTTASRLDVATFLSINPNPVINSCTIIFNEVKQTHYLLTIKDMNGRILFIKEAIAVVGDNRITIDLTKYTSGIYHVNLNDGINNTLKLYKQ